MESITKEVKEFYEELPFNKCENISDRINRIKLNNLRSSYPDLHEIIKKNGISSIIEVGCGTGWLSNTLGHHYKVNVLGIDLTTNALMDARTLSDLMQNSKKVSFLEADLFEFQAEKQFDLLVSLGVLHHTYNTKAAFDHIEKLIKPGGFIYLGLYHKFGRAIFLKMFKELINQHGEDYAFRVFIKMKGCSNDDEVFQKSWFRDQVCHVHENQHTFEEVSEWFLEKGFEILSTSINNFDRIQSLTYLFELEKDLANVSYKRNYLENVFFPGFFTVLAKKRTINDFNGKCYSDVIMKKNQG